MKKATLILGALLLAASLSACNGKNVSTSNNGRVDGTNSTEHTTIPMPSMNPTKPHSGTESTKPHTTKPQTTTPNTTAPHSTESTHTTDSTHTTEGTHSTEETTGR